MSDANALGVEQHASDAHVQAVINEAATLLNLHDRAINVLSVSLPPRHTTH